jgi:hypothetical protein
VTKGVTRLANAELEGRTPDSCVATYCTMSATDCTVWFLSLSFSSHAFLTFLPRIKRVNNHFYCDMTVLRQTDLGPPQVNSPNVIYITTIASESRDSVVGIATLYGLEGPGIESRWGEIFRTYPDRLRGPPSLLYNGYRIFPGGKGGRSVMLTTHSLLVPRLRKS